MKHSPARNSFLLLPPISSGYLATSSWIGLISNAIIIAGDLIQLKINSKGMDKPCILHSSSNFCHFDYNWRTIFNYLARFEFTDKNAVS